MRNLEIMGRSKNLVAYQIKPFVTFYQYQLFQRSSSSKTYYFEIWSLLSKVIVFSCYFLQYGEVLLSSLFDSCYHLLVFIDPFTGCSKSKLLLKNQILLKRKIRFDFVCLL